MGDWDTVTFTPEGSPHPSVDTRSVNGQFSEGYLDVNGVSVTKPVFICNASDVTDISEGAKVTFGTDEFIVEHHEPTGVGFVALFLDDRYG